jgi:hypothetical protein
MKKTVRTLALAYAAALVLPWVLGGCELFLDKPEIDVERAIDEAVAYANALVINVEVQESGAGTANPRGSVQGVKLNYPFRITFNPYNDFGFLGWKASLDGTEIASWSRNAATGEITAMGQGAVRFAPENETGADVSITSYVNPGSGKILIEPVGMDRPGVIQTLPQISAGHFPQRVTIRFSRPIDEESFRFEGGAKTQGAGDALRFRNIHIQDRYNTDIYYDQYFTPPHLSPDGLLLTLWMQVFNNGDYPGDLPDLNGLYLVHDNASYLVSLERTIRDRSGLEMGVKNTFTFDMTSSVPRYDKSPSMRYWFAVNKSRFENGQAAVLNSSGNNGEANHITGAGDFWVYLVFSCTTGYPGYNSPTDEVSEWPVEGVRFYESAARETGYKPVTDAELIDDPALLRSLLLHIQQSGFYSNWYTEMVKNPVYLVKYKIKATASTAFITSHPLSIMETERFMLDEDAGRITDLASLPHQQSPNPKSSYTLVQIKDLVKQYVPGNPLFRIWRD